MRNLASNLIVVAAVFLAGCSSISTPPVTPVQPGTLTIATTSLPGGTVGVVYSAAIAVTGGTTPYTYSATGLPSGLSISSRQSSVTRFFWAVNRSS